MSLFNSWYSFTFSRCISYVALSCQFINNYDAWFVVHQFMVGVPILWSPGREGPMNSCLSIRLYVRTFVASSSQNQFIRDLETETSDKSVFSRKILLCPKIGKKGQKWAKGVFFSVFIKFHKISFCQKEL